MMTRILILAGILCVENGQARADNSGEEKPQLAVVKFEGAVIGLTKSDGSTWDNSLVASVSEQDRASFQSAAWKVAAKGAATANPAEAAAGVVAALATLSLSAKAKPDAFGTVDLSIDGQPVGGKYRDLPRLIDNYVPAWSRSWVHVPLDGSHDVRLRVHLKDWDPDFLGGPETIATVEITRDDLLRAARFGKVMPVYVGDQWQEQIMFVYISVTLEKAPTTPAASQVAAGWYQDPNGGQFYRWWDGQRYTTLVGWWDGQQWMSGTN